MGEPEIEYTQRLAGRRRMVDVERARHQRLGNGRLLYVFLAIALLWAANRFGVSPWIPGFLAAAVLVVLLIWGDRMERRIRFAQRAVTYYERALNRVRDRRNEGGETGERFLDAAHPYALDLDLFGKHSLFQWLSVCRTRAGENLLARWLLAPSEPEDLRSRHVALLELAPRLDLREDLAVLGEEFRSGVHPDALAAWAIAEPIRIPMLVRVLAACLSVIGLIVLGAWIITLFMDPRPPAALLLRVALITVALVEGAIFFRWKDVVNRIAAAAEEPGHDLALLSAVLARIEREHFQSPRLAALRTRLERPGEASRSIGQLNRLIELLESRENWLLRVIGPLILWTTQVSFAVETWRQKNGHAIPEWLRAVAEFEALSSFAASHYEHPEDILPELCDSGLTFSASGLAHPLLRECVPNDVELDEQAQLMIVSGSNMSGKSTLLRTVGTNAVLALAGAPVRAKRMRICRLSVGASIRTSDSLDNGISRFYAEILRIRQILDLPRPVLFLLDELLAGTNSHDRSIGARAILRGLLSRGAAGLATTHDLALSALAEELPHAGNVHFEDVIEEGRMRFDYRMRPGVVTRSNALEIMRSVGLEV